MGAAFALIALTSSALGELPARAVTLTAPNAATFTVNGAGFGHGLGMSQYGAYGAARQGLTWRQILAFYYPGTTRVEQKSGTTIKVWITSDTDNDLRVLPSAGLTLHDRSGHADLLPAGAAYTAWRVKRSGTGYQLSSRGALGSWTARETTLDATTWSFSDTAKIVKVWLPGGSVRELRGTVALAKRGTGGRTVNKLPMEAYVRAVVPSEMPTSWLAAAVRTQAVAARSYAARLKASAASGTGYDLCDTTSCQVYRGYATTSGGRRRVHETTNGNAAVEATSHVILKYGTYIALTQFASSNGGHTARGAHPYLVAQPDPYDGVIRSNAWQRTISAASVTQGWPSVGTVSALQVTSRDGAGRWGGRVLSVKIVGSLQTLTVRGSTFQWKFGLRSNLFTFGSASSGPAAPAAYATFPRSYSRTSRADLLVVGATGRLLRYPVLSGALAKPTVIGSGFGAYSFVANAGDWNGDGYQDVAARTRDKRVLLFRGSAAGSLRAGVDMGISTAFVAMTGVGDVNGDRHPDLVAVTAAGNLRTYYGNGRTGVTGSKRVGTGWSGRDWLRAPGDFDGDGRPDLISRLGSHVYLHRGMATGFAPPVSVGGSWRNVSTITSLGDFDGDGRADVVARTTTGALLLLPGDGKGRLLAARGLTGSFLGTRLAM